MSIAYAHSLSEALYEPLPEGLFQYKFDWDPTLIGFILLGYFYRKGLKAFRGKAPIKRWQIACFCAGLGVNILALVPPIDPLSDRLFFMHMIQHLLIINVGVPLMLFGVPFFVILRGIPPLFRRKIALPILKSRTLRKLNHFLLLPLVSLIIFESNYWFWHVPRYYNLALLNDWIHLVEHFCMAVTALYLWRNIIDPYPLRSPLPMGFRLLFLGAITALDTILAAGLSFSNEIWYAYEGIPMPKWWTVRWGHLDDQRLGGLIMWIPGGFLLFISMTICFFVWANREQRRDQAKEALATH
jgi:cytochrome c oxidase assembly factor CtaG